MTAVVSRGCGNFGAHVRRALRLVLAVSLVLFPMQGFQAAGADLPAVNALPRYALVIGNSRYQSVPLKNPGNDANAFAGQLKGMGFNVTLQLDASREQMLEAFRSFGATLRQSKGIGLFYFAGHGAQVAWRNYLVPVDASIETIEELQSRAVDLNALLDDLIRARNPMNIIILDACRDHPFGSKVVLAQKGLSQLDAPAGTLLAYATSPGNVAADGSGENGLYTEHLLREIQAREAKIEDVFKRVRLNVRRLSKGQQIPWESTSLEQDFYFFPPQAAKKLTSEELERLFEEELELWMRIRASKDTAPLEDYLRRFPSGKFSELAQFRLDRLLALQGEKPARPAPGAAAPVRLAAAGNWLAAAAGTGVAPPDTNPYTRGTTTADWDYRVGDTYTYSRMDAFSRVEAGQFTESVTQVTDLEVIFNRGRRVTDLLGNDVIGRGGAKFSPSQIFVPEYAIGKKWETRFHVTWPDDKPRGRKSTSQRLQEDDMELSFKVVAKESITVPAGTFDAYRVEGHGFRIRSGTAVRFNYWIAPDRVRRVIALEFIGTGQTGRYGRADRFELVSYSQSG